MLIVAGALRAPAMPDYAFLAPAGGTWQVWTAHDGAAPRAITSDRGDKVFLSASAGTGEMLALAGDGTATLLEVEGRRLGTLALGPGAARRPCLRTARG